MLIGCRCAVVGGGIGGLTAAIALAQRGAQVTVHEQADEFREVGAGLQISPNGAVVLSALGLDAVLDDLAVRGQAVRLVDGHTGTSVLRLDLSKLRPDQPYRFLHRADLIASLVDAAGDFGVDLRLNSQVLPKGDGLHCGDGILDADLIVAADGVGSHLRGQVANTGAPTFTGQVAWRALVPLENPQDAEATVHMGQGRHIVSYPLRDRRLLNLVAVREEAAWTEEGWNHPDDPQNMAAAFSDFAPPVRQMLARVERVHRWGLFRHPVAEHWHSGNLALLGDAAHPTLPFLAQGACMAIEDAWVLADSVDHSDTIAAGLTLYQQRRKARCTRIVNAATANARIYHMRNPLMRTAMHGAMRLGAAIAPAAPLKRFDWLYGYDVTAA